MWIDDEGAAHILFATKNIWHDFMRDRFFPGTPIVSTLEYRVIRAGEIVEARNLGTHTKDESTPEAASRQTGTSFYCGGAFHVDGGGTLRIVFATQDGDTFIQQVHPWVDAEPGRLDLETQIPFFFIPTPRMGSEISDVIDLFGPGPDPGELRYARIRL
jgi:hypothetical protein